MTRFNLSQMSPGFATHRRILGTRWAPNRPQTGPETVLLWFVNAVFLWVGVGGTVLLTGDILSRKLVYCINRLLMDKDIEQLHGSRSGEQQEHQVKVIQKLETLFGPIGVGADAHIRGSSGVRWELDGQTQEALFEIYTQPDKPKGSQEDKVRGDVLKLWSAANYLKERDGLDRRKFLVFTSEAASKPFDSKRSTAWQALAVKHAGVELVVVPSSAAENQHLRTVKKRQAKAQAYAILSK